MKTDKCPVCGAPMRKEQKEIMKGVYIQADICNKCEDKFNYEKDMFVRKVFKIGGSLAIRIPKELASVIGLKEGTDVKLIVKDKKLIIEQE